MCKGKECKGQASKKNFFPSLAPFVGHSSEVLNWWSAAISTPQGSLNLRSSSVFVSAVHFRLHSCARASSIVVKEDQLAVLFSF